MKLDYFVDVWLANGPIRPPLLAYEKAAGNVGLTLYRDDRFQVQLWTLPPNSEVTDHKHPAVDTWLVRVAGKVRVRLNGRWKPLHEMDRCQWMGMRTWKMHIRPGDLHGVEVAAPGGSFLNISERIDGQPPVSVHRSWEGTPLDAEHGAALGGG